MSYGFVRVAIVALLAIMAITTGGIVPTIEAYSSANSAGQLVQVHVETALSGVLITVAG